MLLKLTYNQHIHLYKGELCLIKIKKHCSNVFKSIPSNFEFIYTDEDGDEITISTQSDLQILNDFTSSKSIKLMIKEVQAEFEEIKFQSSDENQSCQELLIQGINAFESYRQIYQKQKQKTQYQKMVQETVNKFLEETQSNILSKFMKQEEQMITEEVNEFMKSVEQTCIDNIIKEEQNKANNTEYKTIAVQKTWRKPLINPEQITDDKIDQIIDKKLEKMIPNIVNKVTKMVQRNTRKSCCCQKQQQNIQFQKMINQELLRKIQSKECRF